jgi:hypothetical protein
MKVTEFNELRDSLIASSEEVAKAKQVDYARDFDALDNFKSIAHIVGLEPQQVWAVYFYKHISAVMAWAREGKVESESLRERFVDIINYAVLGYALSVDGDSKCQNITSTLTNPEFFLSNNAFFQAAIDSLSPKKSPDISKPND